VTSELQKKILITDAAGFIGSHLADRLDRGFEVGGWIILSMVNGATRLASEA
jgi:nucleoside-diphosphate-sugar epimerase